MGCITHMDRKLFLQTDFWDTNNPQRLDILRLVGNVIWSVRFASISCISLAVAFRKDLMNHLFILLFVL